MKQVETCAPGAETATGTHSGLLRSPSRLMSLSSTRLTRQISAHGHTQHCVPPRAALRLLYIGCSECPAATNTHLARDNASVWRLAHAVSLLCAFRLLPCYRLASPQHSLAHSHSPCYATQPFTRPTHMPQPLPPRKSHSRPPAFAQADQNVRARGSGHGSRPVNSSRPCS